MTRDSRPLWGSRREGIALVLANLAMAVVCGVSARAVQVLFAAINERFILFWPPVGLALGVTLLVGPRLLWGAFLGILINGVWYGLTPGIAASIAAGDMAEVLVAYHWLTRSTRFDRTLGRGQDYLLLLGVAAVASLAGAAIGVGTGTLAGRIPWAVVPRAWLRWWMGDQLGILLLVPAILTWGQRPTGWLKGRRGEFTAFLVLSALVGQAVYLGWTPEGMAPYAQAFLSFLLVTWSAVRYGRHGVTAILLLVLLQALTGASLDAGAFAADRVQTHLTNFWIFMVALAAVGVTLASVIQERIRAEEAARTEAAFKDQVLAVLPGGLLVFSPEGRIVFANGRAEDLLGASQAQLLGRSAQDPGWRLLQEDLSLLPVPAYPVNRVMATGQPVWNQVVGLGHEDGTPGNWLLVNAFPEIRPDGSLGTVVAMFLDITARKAEEQERQKLEGILQQTQKMESLGTLAGGIAHDMNNVLAGIMMVGSTLQLQLDDHPDCDVPLRTLLNACERGRGLVRKLLEFSRRDLEAPGPVDLNDLVRNEVDLLRHTTRNRVEVRTELAPDLPQVLGEKTGLAAAVMNLSVNALDAMEGGGVLSFHTRRLPDGWVELAVADTGTGMTPEVQARMFDPFFTTKPVGKGTGLGLAMLHTTLKAHGASVEVESSVGQGSCFRLRFPPLPEGLAEVEPDGHGPARDGQASGARRRILLVDDDPLIRETTPVVLQALGFSVETLPHGEACLAWLEAGGRADAVLLDHNMPGVTGLEVLAQLRARGQQVPVILSSGYLDEGQEERALGLPKVWLLRKPYRVDEIRALLEEVLGPGDLQPREPSR